MMVIAPLLDQQGLNLAVPNNVEVQDVKNENKLISVTVTNEDQYFIDGNEIRLTVKDKIFCDVEFFTGEKLFNLEPRRLFPVSGLSEYIDRLSISFWYSLAT